MCMHVCVLTWLSFPSCRMGSRSPPNASQPPAFFSKLTESTSAIVKSKKQEMIKKMTVSNETDFSKSDLWIKMSVEENCRCDFIERLLETLFPLSDSGQPGTEIFNMPASTAAGNLFKPHQIFIWFKVRINVLDKHSSGCMSATQPDLMW